MATAARNGIVEKVTIVIIIILSALSFYFYVQDSRWQSKWSERDAKDFKAAQEAQRFQLEQESANRSKERQNASQVAEAELRLSNEVRENERVKNNLIADYNNGIKRLRAQFRCAASETGKSIQNGQAGAGSNGASKCGLSSGDVEDLIRIAQQANDISGRLRAAQLELCSAYLSVNGEKLNYKVCENEETKKAQPYQRGQ